MPGNPRRRLNSHGDDLLTLNNPCLGFSVEGRGCFATIWVGFARVAQDVNRVRQIGREQWAKRDVHPTPPLARRSRTR